MKKFIVFSVFAFALSFAKNIQAETPPEIHLSGSNSCCAVGTTQDYNCYLRFAEGFKVLLEGGTFVIQRPVGTPLCGGVVKTSTATYLEVIGTVDCNESAFTLKVAWSQTGGKIEVRSRKFPETETPYVSESIKVSPPSVSIVGQSGSVCRTTTSLDFSATAPPSDAIQWTATPPPGSSVPPLTINCPTCNKVTITGFRPNTTYTITCKIFCGGVMVSQHSIPILTTKNC